MKIDRILLVDDNEASNFLARSILQDMDLTEHVDTARNGEEATHKLEENTPDLLFLDMKMPVMDGFQFLERNSKLPDSIQVISLTTNLTPPELARLKDYGVQHFMEKPITRPKVEALIGKISG